ncbi:MAG: hypothetical protein ABMA01_10650 [Chthoniobacteraceae bacterium]
MNLVLRSSLLVVAFVFSFPAGAATVSPEDAEGRLRMALQIAREQNDKALVAEVDKIGRQVNAAFRSGNADGVDGQLRSVESKVGIDPGGWSMAGQPLFHGTRGMLEKSKALGPKLAAAMKADDPAQVRAVAAEMLLVLGDQAGVPDGRRAGSKSAPRPMTEAAATKLFLDALGSEGRTVRQIKEGKPLPDQMVRIYAYVLGAANTIRPFAVRHQPDAVPELDKLARGVAGILVALQQPEGHFPFPDLRGKNIRFGAMIEKQLQAGQVVARDGWIVSSDPDGGSQFDTGLCGTALLVAGQIHANDEWKRAGLRAADWALSQPCCANFNYNAFSVSLLAHAFRISSDAKYLDGAVKKFRVGVAPGQAPNGRWMDAHNARTVYHVIILRALGDLASVLPADRRAERGELDQVTRPAIKALLDEFDAMGMTVEALPELQTLAALYPDDTRLQKATQAMAGSIAGKCTDGKRVKMGAQPNQLAAVPGAFSEPAR